MARPMDDVCPWDVAPGPSIEHDTDTGAQLRHPMSSGVTSSVESQAEEGNSSNLISQSQSVEVGARPSRKNSSQFDSCSSSSDVSLAVTEAVSEHLRKSCSLQQQSSSTGKFFLFQHSSLSLFYVFFLLLSRILGVLDQTVRRDISSENYKYTYLNYRCSASNIENRRKLVGWTVNNYRIDSDCWTIIGGGGTSERIGMTTRNYSIGSVGGRAKLGEIGRPTASSFNYPSPQHSFEYYSHVEIRSEGGKDVAEVVETETRSKEKEKEHARKSSSKAPLISISAIVGDLASESAIAVREEERKEEEEEDCSKDCVVAAKEGAIEIEKRRGEVEAGDKGEAVIPAAEENLGISTRVEAETEESLEEAQVVPVWEPDTRQDDQIAPVTQPAPQQKRDNNVNEVCPWEDE